LIGRNLSEVVPEIDSVLSEAASRARNDFRKQVNLMRGGKERTLSVQVTREEQSTSRDSYVITLDDITDLVIAQRSTAWADVARRIAHEIKNPLTPIQLSAERLKRRYGKQIADDDRAVFDQCTDTIVRQVGGHRTHGGRVFLLCSDARSRRRSRRICATSCAMRSS
jgi:two-component system nitrogen regulation sensor histidine kinase NtrY